MQIGNPSVTARASGAPDEIDRCRHDQDHDDHRQPSRCPEDRKGDHLNLPLEHVTPTNRRGCTATSPAAPAHTSDPLSPRGPPQPSGILPTHLPRTTERPTTGAPPRRRWFTRRSDGRSKGCSRTRRAPGLGGVEGAADQVGVAASAHLGARDRSGSEPALDNCEKVDHPVSPGRWRLEPHNPS